MSEDTRDAATRLRDEIRDEIKESPDDAAKDWLKLVMIGDVLPTREQLEAARLLIEAETT